VVEIVAMSADAGLIPFSDVIAVTGTAGEQILLPSLRQFLK